MPSKDAKIAELEETIERQALTIKRLEERLCELELEVARAKKDSWTSSKPPSSDIVKWHPRRIAVVGLRPQLVGQQHDPFSSGQCRYRRVGVLGHHDASGRRRSGFAGKNPKVPIIGEFRARNNNFEIQLSGLDCPFETAIPGDTQMCSKPDENTSNH